MTDTKDCNCFITLKWKVKVKPSLRDFCESPFDFCKPIACVGPSLVTHGWWRESKVSESTVGYQRWRRTWWLLVHSKVTLIRLFWLEEISHYLYVHWSNRNRMHAIPFIDFVRKRKWNQVNTMHDSQKNCLNKIIM